MTETAGTGRPPRRAHQDLPDVPARVLHGAVRDQPVDEPGHSRSMRPWPCASGRPCGRRSGALGHTVHIIDPLPGLPDMVFAANGATVIGGKVLGARFRYPQRAAEGRGLPGLVRRGGFPATVRAGPGATRARATSCSPGARSWPGTASAPTQALRRRPRGAVRPAGAQPPAGGPALLPPGHRAVRAGRRHRRLLPGGVRRRRPGRAGQPLRRADRGQGRGRRGARAERGQRRPPRGAARAGDRARAPRSPAEASSRCRWTCRNSSKRAAGPSAAPWNCRPGVIPGA